MSNNDTNVNSYNRDFIYIIPQTIFLDLTLHLVDIRVYGLVRSFMDTTKDAYFSNSWAAKKLNVDPLTISRSISKLIKKGYLHRIEVDNQRHLLVGKPIKEDLVSGLGVDPQIKGGRSVDQPPLDLQINQLDQRSMSSNPIREHIGEKEISVSEKLPLPAAVATSSLEVVASKTDDLGLKDIFDALWQHYPLKKAKQNAMKAFFALFNAMTALEAKTLLETVCCGLKAHTEEHKAKLQLKQQGAEIWVPELPHLATWLNQRRWEDGYQTPAEILGTAVKKKGILDIHAFFKGNKIVTT